MTGYTVFAPAKVNLTLHVTGQRPDGYHLLDSFVAFAGVGDVLHARDDRPSGTLQVTGPEAEGVPTDERNLVLQVAAAFWPPVPRIRFVLDKHLPAASGIGGGSADAAACYRAIAILRAERGGEADLTSPEALRELLAIGADIPMCVLSEPARVEGIGERITPVHGLPEFPIVLANPRVPVPTGPVFDALPRKDNAPMEALPPDPSDAGAVLAWLTRQRNDLEAPALAIAPVIGDVLHALAATQGCALARMSGSGATCFAIYPSEVLAEEAAQTLRATHPGWWVAPTRLDGARRAEPQEIRATT